MTASYYFWKWADNDLPGRPHEVHAALLRGELHPALQTFDARPLLKKLERAAVQGRKRGEEWDWQMEPAGLEKQARFVFVTCPALDDSEARMQRFHREFCTLGLSGCDEARAQVIPGCQPKLNCFITGQLPWARAYDITPDDLPFLIKRINPRGRDPFGIIEDRRNYFVQCFAEGRRYIVEWAQNQYHPVEIYDQWRAQDPKRLAALGGIYSGEKIDERVIPDLMRYADTLSIFTAFLRGEMRPATYSWRNVNHLIPNVASDGSVKS